MDGIVASVTAAAKGRGAPPRIAGAEAFGAVRHDELAQTWRSGTTLRPPAHPASAQKSRSKPATVFSRLLAAPVE